MPTTKKRVNLALSEEVYDKLQQYKERYGITSDAGACVMLIVRQLDAIAESERLMEMMKKFSKEELQQMSEYGVEAILRMKESDKN